MKANSVLRRQMPSTQMFAHGAFIYALLILTSLTASLASFAADAGLKVLPGHRPKLPINLADQGQLPGTNRLRLAIGVPLRDAEGLDQFLDQVYDPASTNYQHYLTPDEFTARFGPTAEDYQAVITFARSNGLAVTATHANRLILDVQGPVENIQRAFHVTLLSYRHPSENRDFFAPDREPSVAAELPVADVSGLNNYSLPRPRIRASNVSNGTGSGSSGTYIGNDFRAAYVPNVTLTGAGQMVGLLQFDGYYASDISAYATAAGIAAVPVQTVLLDGYDGTPTTAGNVEVSLDIEMAMAMAPGLSKIVVFEGGPSGTPNDILNAMASSNQVKQLSCSWGWSGGPTATTDTIFKKMAAQGQTFFEASGDSDAFTTGATSTNGVDNTSLQNVPSSSPYITVVGGTTLTTTGRGGPWSAETVWNWGLDQGSYVGSSGGISSYYSIPSWQTGISMAVNGGSTTYRNIPDVALVADNVYEIYGNGSVQTTGGTSCAAPLWAAMAALINQKAVAAGKATIGFVNPAIYAIGKSSGYPANFHDTTTGNNVSGASPNLFYATTGYDLCTGWGTPAGQALIDSLSGATNYLNLLPAAGFTASGPLGGPFNPSWGTFLLTNSGGTALTWSLMNTSAWLAVSSASGTLAAGGTEPLSASLTAAADGLTPGVYEAAVIFSNRDGGTLSQTYTLSIGQSIVENGGFETGDFTGWTLVGNSTVGQGRQAVVYNAVEGASGGFTVIHSGSYGAFLGDTVLATLSQTVPTEPGQYYLLSLWVNNITSGAGQEFILNWNTNSAGTNTLFSVLNPAAFAWTNLQFFVRATGTNAVIQIQAENQPNYFGLDDVSLTPIPSLTFQSAAKVGNNYRLSWNTAPGLVYQVQYKTNLTQATWANLSAAFTAASFSTNLTDTHADAAWPQRFYRLLVSP